MSDVAITRQLFLEDRQGRTFADVLNDPQQPLDQVLAFFNDGDRQRRMEEAEIHHSRPALAGVVRELEFQSDVDRFLASQHPRRTKRLRQAVGVVVRMIMERRGWRKTGKKGSLGVRSVKSRTGKVNLGQAKSVNARSKEPGANHNTGGLAFWFLRAERYERPDGMPFPTVRSRRGEFEAVPPRKSSTD